MKQKTMWTTGLLALSLLGAALPAAATATIWGTPSTANCSSGGTLNANCTPPSLGGLKVIYSAISDNSGSLQAAYVGAYGDGLGVTGRAIGATAQESTTGDTAVIDNRAIDNSGNYEMLLLTFKDAVTNVATPVVMNALNLGFKGADSDLTVLAYRPDPNLGQPNSPNWLGAPYSSLLTNGWKLVGNYADVAPNTARPVNPNSLSSSYWLIGAFNNAFGTGPNLDIGNDYVRLLSVTTTPAGPNGVPEPSSVVLAAIALLGLSAVRRRRHTA